MRVLIIHNFYREKGGEDKVFQEESALLGTTETVMTLAFHNKGGIGGALQFFGSVWNPFACGEVRRAIRSFRPDVVHLHNWHFGCGPAIVRTIHAEQVPVVLTLHNYRLLCPSATLLDHGRIFTDSIRAKFPWKAVGKGLYRGSKVQTFWLAMVVAFHRWIGTWNMPAKYITLTSFARDLFVGSTFGAPAEKFTVKQNFVQVPDMNSSTREDHFLFVGRLTEEKGILPLLEAFSDTGLNIHIAGDGPLRSAVESSARQHRNITYLGALQGDQVQAEMRTCTALVFPSIWYEGMPMTILEAFAAGTPVIASRTGAMGAMITEGMTGTLFTPGSADDLKLHLKQWAALPSVTKTEVGKKARQAYDETYTPEVNHRLLLDIYARVIDDGRKNI